MALFVPLTVTLTQWIDGWANDRTINTKEIKKITKRELTKQNIQ